jgi:hypothetical protein
MKKVLDFLFLFVFIGIAFFLFNDESRAVFIRLTVAYPILMGFVKFSVLATMGDMLVKRIVLKKWIIKGAAWHQRALVWGCLGIVLTYVFPIYSEGVNFLIYQGMLPVFSNEWMDMVSSAFWKSFFMNVLFAFPMMVSHRITDTLIDKKMLFSRWPFMELWTSVNWKNMWGFVAPSIVWFWIPAHTITFCLPPEYRIIMAAGLSICLGAILAFAKMKSKLST